MIIFEKEKRSVFAKGEGGDGNEGREVDVATKWQHGGSL